MTKNPLISIIIPVKDTAKYLSDCLDSIVNQTYENWEVLAVNDGSSDNSLAILHDYESRDSRIKALDNPKLGLLLALRLGYKHSTGGFIHRMDSDDKMPIDKLEVMSEALISSGKHSVVTGGAEYFMDEGEVGDGFNRYVAWLSKVSRENTHAENIYKESVIASNCWLVHREDFDAIGGFEPDTFPEDYDLCFRFYAGGLKIVGLDKILHLWRDRSDRISRNWDVYKDNRFLDLKTDYFIKVELDANRPLVIWGAGRNGKDIVRLLQSKEVKNINWVCDNERKIGKDIYDIRMEHYSSIPEMNNPQIIIAVASPDDQKDIEVKLITWGLKAGTDYWFFS